jgi:NADPH:quinone reductase-like Zn-dependent oxidoreductase
MKLTGCGPPGAPVPRPYCRAMKPLNSLLSMVLLSGTAAGFGASPGNVSPSPGDTMRKVVLEHAAPAPGYRWKIEQAPIPTVGESEVLVRVHAVSLNRGDLVRLERGSDDDRTGKVPVTDAAGEVVAVGSRVKGIHKGERVTNTYFKNWVDGPFSHERLDHVPGWTADGVLADYIVLASTDAIPIPDGMSYEEASTLPTAGLTAWNAVAGKHELHAGDVVLVQGTGGVSTFALQFAVAAGARVIVTSSSDDKLARARALGARDGINYKAQPEWARSVLQLTQGHGADLVVDVGGKATLTQSVDSLADGGTLSVVGGLTGYDGDISAWGLLKKAATAQTIFVGSRADYLRMLAFMKSHRLQPLIERVFPLNDYEEALKLMATGQFTGKIVLDLN